VHFGKALGSQPFDLTPPYDPFRLGADIYEDFRWSNLNDDALDNLPSSQTVDVIVLVQQRLHRMLFAGLSVSLCLLLHLGLCVNLP
jgi:hypothetical protein